MNLRALLSRIAIVLSLAVLPGCSSTTSDARGGATQGELLVRQPELVEKQLFEAMRDYYCEHKQWPQSLADVEVYEVSRGADEGLFADFKDAHFDSQRAIILTMTYQNALGIGRKVSFIAPPQCNGEATEGRVSIAGGRIRFDLPAGFRLMGGADVKARWKSPPYPDAAWVNEGDTLIAIRFGDVEVSADELVALSADLEQAYQSSIPSIAWLKREPIAVNGRTLLEHEFESDSSRGRIVSYVISSTFDNKLVAITVIGPVSSLVDVDEVARRIEQTLVIR
jgi:hypothetical protein